MGILDVPGARLYYETQGSGPLMVDELPGSGVDIDTCQASWDTWLSHPALPRMDATRSRCGK